MPHFSMDDVFSWKTRAEEAEAKLKETLLQNSELRIHLRAMCDEIGDPVRFREARELALKLLGEAK